MKAKTKAAGKGESKVVLKLVDVVAIGHAAAHLAHDIEALGTLQSMGFIGLSASGREISAKVPDSKEEFFFLEYEICPSNQKPCKLVRMRRGVCQEIDAGRTMYIEAAPNAKGILQVTVRGDRLSQWTLNCTVPAALVHEEYIHTVRTKGIMSQKDVLPGSSARVALPPMPPPPAAVAKPKAVAVVVKPVAPAPVPVRTATPVVVPPAPVRPVPTPAPAPRAVTPAPPAPVRTVPTLATLLAINARTQAAAVSVKKPEPVAPPTVAVPVSTPAPVAVITSPSPSEYPHAQAIIPAWAVFKIPVNRIRPNPEQPRDQFKKSELDQLGKSFIEDGQIEPIEVVEVKGDPKADYELVRGERRWRAAQHIGLGMLNAIIHSREVVPDRDAQHRRCFISDFHHAGYNKVEIIRALLREERAGATQAQLSAMCGKKPTWISDHLTMRNLHPDIFKLLDSSLPRREQISFSVARELVRAPQEQQPGMYQNILKIKGQALQLLEAKNLVKQYVVRKARKVVPSDASRHFLTRVPSLLAAAKKAADYGDEVFASLVQSHGAEDVALVLRHLETTAEKLNSVRVKIMAAQKAKALATN